MKESTIESIGILRAENYTYACIGRALSMSTDTVKSVCRRYGFVPREGEQKKNVNKAASITRAARCKFCDSILRNPWNRRNKIFCSNKCRYTWWNLERRVPSHDSVREASQDIETTVGNGEEESTDEV